jgi:uncharacterized protein with von Willebrand factor type A (vWA) domain
MTAPGEPPPLGDELAPSARSRATRRPRHRYLRWDGSQRLDFDADDVLDALSDDLLAEGDLAEALRRLLQRGFPPGRRAADRVAGLREVMERLAAKRRDVLERYKVGDVLADVRRELEEILDTERAGVERRLAPTSAKPETSDRQGKPGKRARSERAQDRLAQDQHALEQMSRTIAERHREALDALPEDPGGRIRALQDYDFLEPAARDRFEALLEKLRQQVLDSYLKGLNEQLKGVTPEQLAANREMVRDLNRLLQERLNGGDPDASEFLAKHGGFFPGAQTLDDVIEQLAERMAAMQSLLASMSAEQRAELQALMDSLLRDDRLRWDLAQLAATLDRLLPGGLGERLDFRGNEPLSLEGALEQLAQIQALERLGTQLGGADDPAALADIDLDEVRHLLDGDSAQDVEGLQKLARALEEAGYAERVGRRLELTPRGSRRIGEKVLDRLFARLRRDAFGGHARRSSTGGGERTEGSKPWVFSEPFDLDLQRTLSNALAREENGGGAMPIRLAPEDFEVHRAEDQSRAATVLLVDMSRSMLLRGCFLAAKKVAIALDTLIRTRFPRDELHIIGFAYYAREIRPEALAALSWHGYEYGTNLQHGLALARRLLSRSHAANREVVIVTDGEPTAHFQDGQIEFSYPPTRRTIVETLKEVGRCTREGVTINTFMLERSRPLTEFVDRMTRLNRGRAFYADPEQLGEYVLVDYVSRRSSRVA